METQIQMGVIQASGDREDGTHFTLVSEMGFHDDEYNEFVLVST